MNYQVYNLRKDIIDATAKFEKAKLQLEDLESRRLIADPCNDLAYAHVMGLTNVMILRKAKMDVEVAEMELNLLKTRLKYFLDNGR